MTTIQKYLEARHADGGPDSDRFEPDPDEVHASHGSDCQRKRLWKFEKRPEPGADSWPYFELGRILEDLYGAALVLEHDPEVTPATAATADRDDLTARSDYVEQDVNVEIEEDGFVITGECDWVVFGNGKPVDEVVVASNGDARWRRGGETGEYRGRADLMIETKTTGNLRWKRANGYSEAHRYQVAPYLHALRCPGEIVYISRDDLETLTFEVERDAALWADFGMRAAAHAENYVSDEDVAPATPLNESECKFCPFEDECREHGGSEYL